MAVVKVTKAVIQQWMICPKCDNAEVVEVEKAKCPDCKVSMVNMGWMESLQDCD